LYTNRDRGMHFRSALRKLVKPLLSLRCLFAGNLSLPLISITKGIIPPVLRRGILDRNNFLLARGAEATAAERQRKSFLSQRPCWSYNRSFKAGNGG
jgi:hypothetical protein